jgi:hypothetical protein
VNTFHNGKFTYDTYVDSTNVEITLDLNHPQIRRLIFKAIANKSQRAGEAGGALVVKVVKP